MEHGVAYVLCAGSPLRGQTGALRNARPNTVTWWLSEANAASITIEVVFLLTQLNTCHSPCDDAGRSSGASRRYLEPILYDFNSRWVGMQLSDVPRRNGLLFKDIYYHPLRLQLI